VEKKPRQECGTYCHGFRACKTKKPRQRLSSWSYKVHNKKTMMMNTTRCHGLEPITQKKNTRTMNATRCFGLVGCVIKKKTMTTNVMLVVVVSKLTTQEQN
jgi:hypothetical protein